MVGIGVANATHSEVANSAGPPKDFAVGGGKHLFTIKFSFSAHSGPLGEDPKGQIQLDFGDRKIKAEVICVIVAGNEAFITGFSDELPGNGIVVTHAVDNGEPSDPQPDLLRNSFEPFIFESPERPGCFRPVLEPVPVTEGNIVVHDGQPN
ncbi:MAG TPA: hypothetical protein VK357_02905 [Rubrobacteraceae bacterium]|nr:hypothetical protein [Rubrobacteraceae bacterium]